MGNEPLNVAAVEIIPETVSMSPEENLAIPESPTLLNEFWNGSYSSDTLGVLPGMANAKGIALVGASTSIEPGLLILDDILEDTLDNLTLL